MQSGTLALCGFPLLFSGFWSKDAILHAAHEWSVSQVPFYLGAIGALLTAFYMTRQVCYVFFGARREPQVAESPRAPEEFCILPEPHESPAIMTTPLVILAICAVLLGFHNTPAWPWLASYLRQPETAVVSVSPVTASWNPVVDFTRFAEAGLLPLMLLLITYRPRRAQPRLVALRTQAHHSSQRPGSIGTTRTADLSRASKASLRRRVLRIHDHPRRTLGGILLCMARPLGLEWRGKRRPHSRHRTRAGRCFDRHARRERRL